MFKGGEEEGKVLGIVWNQKVDKLRFKVKADWFNVSEFTEQGQVTLTKRQILSQYKSLVYTTLLGLLLHSSSERRLVSNTCGS